MDNTIFDYNIAARQALLERLYGGLSAAIGPTGWWTADTPFEVCIGAILTQNAPWSGVTRAIDALKTAGLMDADVLAETDPGVKGDTAQGGVKPATLETGAIIRVPLFIENEEVVKVDTRTGEYVGRVKD